MTVITGTSFLASGHFRLQAAAFSSSLRRQQRDQARNRANQVNEVGVMAVIESTLFLVGSRRTPRVAVVAKLDTVATPRNSVPGAR